MWTLARTSGSGSGDSAEAVQIQIDPRINSGAPEPDTSLRSVCEVWPGVNSDFAAEAE